MLEAGDPGSEWADPAGLRAPRRPLVGVALTVIAGTLAGLFFPWPFFAVLPIALGFAGAALFLPRRFAGPALLVSLAATAFLRVDLAVRDPSPRALHRVMSGSEEGVSVVGTVVEEPLTRAGFDGSDRFVFAFRTEAVNRTGTWQSVHGVVTCTVGHDDLPRAPAYGDAWLMNGSLRPPRPSDGSDEGTVEGRLLGFGGERLARNRGSALVSWCLAGRRACAAALGKGLEDFPTHHALLKALLLGYRDELPPDLRKAFSATGTLHMFAISGLHVGVLCGLLAGLLNTVGVPRHRWALFLGPALILYTMATGLRPSAVRACVMALCFWFSAVAWRRPDGLSALALAAVLMLIWSPLELMEPGFVLSFTVVAGLLVVTPPVLRVFRAWVAPDPWAPVASKGPVKRGRDALAWCTGLLVFSLVAWTVSFPLTATFFNIFSPIAVVGNLLVVPAAFVVVSTGCLSVVASPFSGFLAEVFNHANRVLIDLLLGFIDLMAAVPGGYCYVRTPQPAWIAVWYILLAMWAMARPNRRKWVRLGTLTLVLGLAWGWAQARPGPLELNVLDARGGVVVHVDAGGKDHVLVNTGSAYQGWELMRHLRSRGVNRLAAVMLSSGSNADSGGLDELREAVPFDELWLPPGTSGPTNLPDQVRARTLVRGEGGVLGDGTQWTVLAPAARMAYEGSTAAAPLIRFGRDGLGAVFVGGWDPVKAQELARARVEIRAPVLIWGVRGPPRPEEAGFERIGPECVLISVKPFRTLTDDYAPAIRELGRSAEIIRTDRAGGVLLRSRLPRLDNERPGYEVQSLD